MKRPSGGFTLLEVLVSVLVLAIGLLGMAALQMIGLQNNHKAFVHSQATQLAYDLADRMRANQPAIYQNYYHTVSAPTSNPTCTACNLQELVARDLYEWNQEIKARLPGGAGSVCLDSTPSQDSPACDGTGNVYKITVSWTERENDASVPKTFNTTFLPRIRP